jgi:hypothetical protein
MAVLIDPNKVKVIAQNGQVTLALQIDLNINLNALGLPTASNFANTDLPQKGKSNIAKEDDDSAAMLVPDFTSKEKVKFGK